MRGQEEGARHKMPPGTVGNLPSQVGLPVLSNVVAGGGCHFWFLYCSYKPFVQPCLLVFLAVLRTLLRIGSILDGIRIRPLRRDWIRIRLGKKSRYLPVSNFLNIFRYRYIFFTQKLHYLKPVPVLCIRVGSDPYHFPESGSVPECS
jgi:hypothetical protein